jgi:Na+-translocating ferredoxin:NAD+ oxidoreductase subunit B
MEEKDDVYRSLQLHLDKETIGFPATKSGSDIRVLKTLFTPEQAEVATMLTHRYESLEQIYGRAGKGSKSLEEIELVLDSTAERGVIGHRKRNGTTQYRNIPYLIGMLEAAASNPTPEFVSASAEYAADGRFGRAFITTKVPQMRTIPVGVSVEVQRHVATYDAIREIVTTTVDPIVIIECVCRKGAADRGDPCKRTSRKETCMVFRDGAKNLIEGGGIGRQITKDEAFDILKKNEEEGLVLQPSNAQKPDFICSCCGCCCGILRLHKALPNPVSIWATNFYARVNPDLCSACGSCVEKCQTGAMKLSDRETVSVVDLARCLGCGLCVTSCLTGAIELRRKEAEIVPPADGEEMMEVIMTHKTHKGARAS